MLSRILATVLWLIVIILLADGPTNSGDLLLAVVATVGWLLVLTSTGKKSA